MKVSFYNLGCKVNLADISRLGKQFEELGHDIVDFEVPSDIVLINTCTVTHRADADCRNIVRRALKKSPSAFIGVLGCYAQLKPEEIAKIEGVDAVIGTKEKFEVTKLIEKFEKQAQTQILVSELKDIPFHTSAVTDNAGRTRAILKIQDGCNYHCTFCTIPMARGASRGMNFDEIEPEIRKMEAQGFREIVLSGINLGDYKSPSGEKFIDVVKLITDMDTKVRFRISSIEPNLLKEEMLDIIANSKNFCRHFHIPLQSGSPEILRKMKRRYQTKEYKALVESIKAKMPDCAIGADVIIGFPGESDEHFQETVDFIKNLPFTYLHVFTYSERDNTPAINYSGVVPFNIRKERTNILRHISEEKRIVFDNENINSTRKVIPEIYNHDNGLWKGWTENYVSVIFPGNKNLPKEEVLIHLDQMIESKVIASIVDENIKNSLNTNVKSNKQFEMNVLSQECCTV